MLGFLVLRFLVPSLGEAYIPNLSLLLCLEVLEKFVVGWWWSKLVLVFSLSQAEQNLEP